VTLSAFAGPRCGGAVSSFNIVQQGQCTTNIFPNPYRVTCSANLSTVTIDAFARTDTSCRAQRVATFTTTNGACYQGFVIASCVNSADATFTTSQSATRSISKTPSTPASPSQSASAVLRSVQASKWSSRRCIGSLVQVCEHLSSHHVPFSCVNCSFLDLCAQTPARLRQGQCYAARNGVPYQFSASCTPDNTGVVISSFSSPGCSESNGTVTLANNECAFNGFTYACVAGAPNV
jgi:hypothetical protein